MNFRLAVIATVLVVIAGPTVWIFERTGRPLGETSSELKHDDLVRPVKHIIASGWIEGRTANIELRSRLAEQVVDILVEVGDWVKQGDIVLALDCSQYLVEQARAEAQVLESQAKLQRVENGFRDSEIEAARNDFATRAAEWEGAQKSLERMELLMRSKYISPQIFEDEQTRVRMLESMASGAKSRLQTMESPPREDELSAARAAVAAAEAFRSLATLNLERTKIRAPVDAKVLRINVEVGELVRPDQTEPLAVFSDVSTLRAVVEIDEYDALCVRVGQPAQLKVDSSSGILARGKVSEIEPQLTHKQLDMSRPGERKDTFSRRIWIELENAGSLPVGLPIEVSIEVLESEGTKLSIQPDAIQPDAFEWQRTS